MANENEVGRTPAFDTSPIPLWALSVEEKNIIRDVNGLLTRIQEVRKSSGDDRGSNSDSIWARPDKRRTNNVIMLEGERGVGKTSLLHTLLHG